jgi:hypothetical protein
MQEAMEGSACISFAWILGRVKHGKFKFCFWELSGINFFFKYVQPMVKIQTVYILSSHMAETK